MGRAVEEKPGRGIDGLAEDADATEVRPCQLRAASKACIMCLMIIQSAVEPQRYKVSSWSTEWHHIHEHTLSVAAQASLFA